MWAAENGTLKLDNQKNDIRGVLIQHTAVGGECCPVKAFAQRVWNLRQNKASKEELLCTFFDHLGKGSIRDDDVVKIIWVTAATLCLQEQGFLEERLDSHSLQAGGAMALKLNHADKNIIKKLGRWSNDTFLMYIHEEIGEVTKGWAQKMATSIPYHHVKGGF